MHVLTAEPRAVDAVVFDMDGVIFEGHNFWLDLHRAYGTEAAALDLAGRYLTSNYALLARITAERLWKGLPSELYVRLVAQREYQPGVPALFARLHGLGVPTIVVSSGSDLLAARAQSELGIDEVAANGVGIQDGTLSGELFLHVSDTDKAGAARSLLARLGVRPDRAASVGDSDSDVGVARMVALPVAYDSTSDELLGIASYTLPHGQLGKVADIIEGRTEARRE